ncbi:ATP-binding protein [Puniceibacterium sp. IMCC21224]|uniref:ATP-binding protein n=1 Tax=Puniceibacterium sp. IMCC21224 TaxID=1618204 RepID=UPI0018CEA39F|nr:ATP-binding protein [Puniceibacterium sp. IMCC21224]
MDEADLQLNHIAELLQTNVESSLSISNIQIWNALDRVAQLPLRDADWVDETYGALLRGVVQQVEQIDSLVLIDRRGTVIWASVGQLVGVDLSDRQYFQRALNLTRGQYAIGVPIASRGTDRRVTPIAWPILNREGVILGVAASALGEDYFAELLSSTGFQSDMIIEMVTENGDVAFSAPKEARDLSVSVLSASRQIPSLDLTVTVSRSREAILLGQLERSVAFVTVSVLLFATALGIAIHSQLKSFKLAESLYRTERGNRRIQAAQKEFDAIFQNVADGIVVFGDDRSMRRANKKARDLLDASNAEEASSKLMELIPWKTELGGEPRNYKLNMNRDAGKGEPMHIQARAMSLELNGMNFVYCVLSDITSQERLTSARDSFITSINHELRTPLTSLAGALDMLEGRFGEQLPNGAGKLVDMAARNADRLLMLVNDILTLQAIDQQQLHFKLEQLSVSDALAEALSTNTGYGMGAGVKLVLEQVDQQAYFMADRMRLQQVFSNIISNAVKYSPKGGEVRIGASIDEGSVSFWVSDRGPGIPESARGRLFQRFTAPVHGQGVQATGTGLGLAITKELVKRQDGKIALVSKPIDDHPSDHGSTFYVIFSTVAHNKTPEEQTA